MKSFLRYLCFIVVIFSPLNASQVQSTESTLLQASWLDSSQDFSPSKALFIQAFTKAYKTFSPEDLKLAYTSKEEWLEETFIEEAQDFEKQNPQIWLLNVTSKMDDQILGAMTVNKDVFEDQPALYIRQFATRPDSWGQGIGRFMFEALLEKFPNYSCFLLLVRVVNKDAINFYKHLGFKEGQYSHPDYIGKPYVGMVKRLKKKSF